jgi:hypothetical protein
VVKLGKNSDRLFPGSERVGKAFRWRRRIRVAVKSEQWLIVAVACAIGMYFSQMLMKNYPSLKWEQPLGNKTFTDSGQPCLAGFGLVSPNPVRIGHVFAHGLASKTYTGKRLREVYDYWAQRVQLAS